MSEMGDIEKRMDAILNRLDSDIQKKKNSMTISIIGGIILLIVVFIYFGWIKGLVREVMEPEGLMLQARAKVEEMLPEMAKSLETQLKKEAPNIASYSSQELLKAIPEARIYMEHQFIRKTEEALESFVGEFDKMVSQALEDNRTDIVGFMRDIEDPVKKDLVSEEIYESLKKQFDQPYIKSDLETYTKVLQRLNKKIKYLYEGEHLTEEEAIIRDILFSLRELASRGATKKI